MSTGDFRRLARELGVQTTFTDVTGVRRSADPDALLAVVRALCEDLERPEDASVALRELRDRRAARLIEPVVVAWDGRLPEIDVHAPARGSATARIELEEGEELVAGARIEPSGPAAAAVRIDATLPPGAHRLVLEPRGRRPAGEAVVLSAPSIVGRRSRGREWGIFLPLHALVTERGWGIGDLGDLATLAEWVRSIGGGVVASLPLLAGFPDEASPYSPASRLFWDERYLDVDREVTGHPRASRLVRSKRFAEALEAARRSEFVDHAEVARLKRQVLGRLADERAGDPDLRRYVRDRPEVESYARFRAAGERWGRDWRAWPAPARDGAPRPRDLDPGAVAYHRFAQFVADGQIAEFGHRTGESGGSLYLDMPLGAHPDGFDVWRFREDFASSVSVGAPPDGFFRAGQDWGFPPLHPLRVRERGYGYVRACLRHVFRHAGVVRVDHVIGLHRQYWVPLGLPPDRGVFVRARAEEWYAALSLEAHRHGTVVVGEDLGTVPAEVRAGMRRHGVLRSYVVEYEAVPGRDRVPGPGREMLAALSTHDMPTFAAFWRGADVDDRVRDGLLGPGDADVERRSRRAVREALLATLRDGGVLRAGDPTEREVLEAALLWLAGSDARYVIVNLEDLWSELHPVNVPGVSSRPNWRRRSARSLEEIRRSPHVLEILRRVDRARAGRDRPRDGSGDRPANREDAA